MPVSPKSSYDGCIEEEKLKLANGNSVLPLIVAVELNHLKVVAS
jgi:hypothetical protein